MQKTHIFAALCALTVASIAACKKYSNTPTPTYVSMSSVFAQQAVQPTVANIDAAKGGSFYGASGSRFSFSPNSFLDANGNVISGQVRVEVKEYTSKGDMIFSQALPISNGEPLLSGGEVGVSAWHNDQKVFLAPGKPFTASIPQNGPIASDMQLFVNHPVNGNVNWVVDTSHPIERVHSFYGPDTLNIISDSLTMCNADAFMANPDMQTFTVTAQVTGVDAITDNDEIFAYALYDTYKGVWPIGSYTGSRNKNVFSEYHVPNIPVHFAVFMLKGGKFYSGVIAATPHNDSNYVVPLILSDPATFKEKLNDL